MVNKCMSKAKTEKFLTHTLPQCRIMVIGDSMVDSYYFGEVKRISPEAPVPIASITQIKETLGGAANVAHNLARLGCQVELAGITGQDAMRQNLLALLEKQGIGHESMVAAHDRPTITKTRVIGGHQQILRLDFETVTPLPKPVEKELLGQIADKLPKVEAVILSDYAKGVCSPGLCREVIRLTKENKKPLVVDPKGQDWKKYAGAFVLTPNLKELREAVHKEIVHNDSAVAAAALQLIRRYHLEYLLVTRSEQGLSLLGGEEDLHVPTAAQEVFDVSGAGDTVAAVIGAGLAGGLMLADAARLANLAAGVVVGKVGTYAISRKELVAVCQKT